MLVVLLCVLALGGSVLVFQVDSIRWRAQLIALKASGQIPGLSWREMFALLPASSGVWLKPVVASRNPYASIVNRLNAPDDIRAGRALFQTHCALCHGADGGGATGPGLMQGDLRRGTADWALFRTISQGIPGTAMEKRDLPPRAVWQLVAFVKDVATRTTETTEESEKPSPRIPDVTFDRLVAAGNDGSEWLMYSGTYDGQRHSRLAQVERGNVDRLRVKWLFQLPTDMPFVQNTPLVVGNVMFVSLPPGDVWALDARTGSILWTYRGGPAAPGVKLATQAVNRGVAILGTTLYVARIDATLVALDANTGRELWKTRVGDIGQGYSMTSAPLAVRDAVVVGVGGGEFGVRGFIDAYSPADGKRMWRFYTVPGPGEAGHDTWSGESWKRGGAPTWLTGSYDPDSDLVYWGVGNPAPLFDGDPRQGDNLYSNSVVALERQTGRLRWHFQFSPHDEHDWDSAQIPVLADAVYRGRPRKLMYWANRNGFYYVLDRLTGEFLHGQPFVKQTWTSGLGPTGRPIEGPSGRPTRQGTVVYPSIHGGTNWWSPSYDSKSNTFFVAAMEMSSIFTKSDELITTDGALFASSGRPAAPGQWLHAIRALDAATGDLRWEHRFRGRARMAGVMSTSGGLVFASDGARFFALDDRNGNELWRMNTGGAIDAAPIAYLADGRQQVTIAAGRAIVTFSLDGQ